MVDATCGGSLICKSDIEAWDFFKNLSENSQQWGSSSRFDRNSYESKRAGMYELNTSPQLMAKLDGISQKLEAFISTSTSHSSIPSSICAICSSHTHSTQHCPSSASYPELIEDLNAIQNFQKPSHNNPYSETYNPGWARHPNFSWSKGQYQGGPPGFTQPSAPRPQFSQPSVQPQKQSLEDTLHMFMQSTMQFQQATQSTLQANTQAIAKLEIQMGQLATSLSEREKGTFPAQPQPNPRFQGQAKSVNESEGQMRQI